MTETLIRNDDFVFLKEGSVITAGWENHLSADSPVFLDSVQKLVNILTVNKITGLFLISGPMAGGTLTEDTIKILEKASPGFVLEKIAVLESSDFLWDNNVVHLLNYIKQVAGLPTQIMSFSTKPEGFKWLKEYL